MHCCPFFIILPENCGLDLLPKKFTESLAILPGMDLAAFLRVHETGEKIAGEVYTAKKQRDALTAVSRKDRDKVQQWLKDMDNLFQL
jgi:hypothetical protein